MSCVISSLFFFPILVLCSCVYIGPSSLWEIHKKFLILPTLLSWYQRRELGTYPFLPSLFFFSRNCISISRQKLCISIFLYLGSQAASWLTSISPRRIISLAFLGITQFPWVFLFFFLNPRYFFFFSPRRSVWSSFL